MLTVVYCKQFVRSTRERVATMFYGAIAHYLLGEASLIQNGVNGGKFYEHKFSSTQRKKWATFVSHLEDDGSSNMRDFVANCPYYILLTGHSGGLIGEGSFEGRFCKWNAIG